MLSWYEFFDEIEYNNKVWYKFCLKNLFNFAYIRGIDNELL